jgi:hypothetical protein
MPDHPGTPNDCGAFVPLQLKVYYKKRAKLAERSGYGFFLAGSLQQNASQLFDVIYRQPKNRLKDKRLVAASSVVGIEAILSQLDVVDDRRPSIWQLHRTTFIEARNSFSKSPLTAASLAAASTAFCATGLG